MDFIAYGVNMAIRQMKKDKSNDSPIQNSPPKDNTSQSNFTAGPAYFDTPHNTSSTISNSKSNSKNRQTPNRPQISIPTTPVAIHASCQNSLSCGGDSTAATIDSAMEPISRQPTLPPYYRYGGSVIYDPSSPSALPIQNRFVHSSSPKLPERNPARITGGIKPRQRKYSFDRA